MNVPTSQGSPSGAATEHSSRGLWNLDYLLANLPKNSFGDTGNSSAPWWAPVQNGRLRPAEGRSGSSRILKIVSKYPKSALALGALLTVTLPVGKRIVDNNPEIKTGFTDKISEAFGISKDLKFRMATAEELKKFKDFEDFQILENKDPKICDNLSGWKFERCQQVHSTIIFRKDIDYDSFKKLEREVEKFKVLYRISSREKDSISKTDHYKHYLKMLQEPDRIFALSEKEIKKAVAEVEGNFSLTNRKCIYSRNLG